jgi:hypothetical protein
LPTAGGIELEVAVEIEFPRFDTKDQHLTPKDEHPKQKTFQNSPRIIFSFLLKYLISLFL